MVIINSQNALLIDLFGYCYSVKECHCCVMLLRISLVMSHILSLYRNKP